MTKRGSTLIEVRWKDGKESRAIEYDEKGDKMPATIRVMLVSHLLSKVRGQYEVDVRSK